MLGKNIENQLINLIQTKINPDSGYCSVHLQREQIAMMRYRLSLFQQ